MEVKTMNDPEDEHDRIVEPAAPLAPRTAFSD
jgi:hypothetical protein